MVGPRPASRSLRPHPIVLRIVLELAETECLHERRNVDPESSAQTFLQTVPTANRVFRRTPPGFDRSLLSRFLLFGSTKFHPISGCFEHGMEVVDAASVVEKDGLADGTHEHPSTVPVLNV